MGTALTDLRQFLATLTVIVALAAVTAPADIYVDLSWTGAGAGTATDPYTTLQDAATAFAAGGTTVRVAGGLYSEGTNGEEFGTTGYDISSQNGTWMGGYSGWDGSGSGTSDFDWNTRVLPDAGSLNSATMSVVDLTDANARAFYASAYDRNIDFDGFAFQNSNVSQSGYSGGALLLEGGMGASEVKNCVFLDNQTTGDGGALRLTGRFGTSTNCTFIGNSASGNGGAASINPGNSYQTIDNFVFGSNTASGNGGALYSPSASLNIYNSTFTDNEATLNGGALAAGNSNGTRALYDCYITGNTATDGAAIGAANYKGASIVLENTLVADNTATSGTGYVILSSGADSGGDVTMRFVTLANNDAPGGAVYANRSGTRVATVSIQNSILAGTGSGVGIYADPDSTPTIQCNDVWSFGLLYDGSASADPGSFSVDPLFVDAAGEDYRLTVASDLVGAGVDIGIALDLIGDDRDPSNPTIGAFETAVPEPTAVAMLMLGAAVCLRRRRTLAV